MESSYPEKEINVEMHMNCSDLGYMRTSINICYRSDFGAYKPMYLLMHMVIQKKKDKVKDIDLAITQGINFQ